MLAQHFSVSVEDFDVKAIGLPFLKRQVPRLCLLALAWTVTDRSY